MSNNTVVRITANGLHVTDCDQRDENIAAISAEIHNHPKWQAFYDAHCDAVGGFTGFWRFAIDAADAFTKAESVLEDDGDEAFSYPEAIFDFTASIVTAADLPTHSELDELALIAITNNSYNSAPINDGGRTRMGNEYSTDRN